MLRPRRDMRRETSPSNTPITTPMRIGNFDISAGELLSGTIVATIEKHELYHRHRKRYRKHLALEGRAETHGGRSSYLRRRQNAGNIGI